MAVVKRFPCQSRLRRHSMFLYQSRCICFARSMCLGMLGKFAGAPQNASEQRRVEAVRYNERHTSKHACQSVVFVGSPSIRCELVDQFKVVDLPYTCST